MDEVGDGLGPAHAQGVLSAADAAEIARRYVGAYNQRSLDAMLALLDPEIVSYPSPLFGQRRSVGHAGVSAWWRTMEDAARWYDVAIGEVRALPPDRVAVLGEICEGGESLSPWAVLVRVRDGLIVESRSYLTGDQLLEELGLLG